MIRVIIVNSRQNEGSADSLLKNTLAMKKLNEENSKNLHELEIDLDNLPHEIQSTIKEYVDIQSEIGLHDLDIINLEIWHGNKKVELHTLKQDVLKPLQRKMRNLNREIQTEEQKVEALKESIDYFKSAVISEENMTSETETLWQSITSYQTKIKNMPKPPVQLDIDELIDKIQISKAKLKQ